MAQADIARKTFRASGVIAAPDTPGGTVYTINATTLGTALGLPVGVCGIGNENEAGFNSFKVMMTGGGGQTWDLDARFFSGSVVTSSEAAPWSRVGTGLAQTDWAVVGATGSGLNDGTVLPPARPYMLRVTASGANADLRIWVDAEAFDTL